MQMNGDVCVAHVRVNKDKTNVLAISCCFGKCISAHDARYVEHVHHTMNVVLRIPKPPHAMSGGS